MKHILALSLALAATGCGQATDTAQVRSDAAQINQVKADDRQLIALEGEISNVQIKSADTPAAGIWTEVSVTYEVNCAARFESAALSYDIDQNGNAVVLSSAFVSVPQHRNGLMFCQAFSLETRTLALPGFVTRENVKLVNLAAAAQAIPEGTVAIRPISDIKVISTHSLCPAGSICAKSGTVVTLEMTLNSCVNDLGPVTYRVDQAFDLVTAAESEKPRIKLAVSAIEFINQSADVVRCLRQHTVTHSLSLPLIFGSVETIDLQAIL